MINPKIIHEVVEQPLCIDHGYLMSVGMAVACTFFGAQPVPGAKLEVASYIEPYAWDMLSASKQTGGNYKPGSIGVVSIDGPILETSDGSYGLMGTLEAAQAFQANDQNPNISAHVMYMNSGGGAAYAIKPFRDVIKARTKPLVVFSNKILASAAYGLAADADHIIMYHPHGVVGSLGTMSSSRDMQPMFEKWGMKFDEFYATASKLKNKTYRDAKNGKPEALIENVLNPMNDTYLSNIKEDRGDRINQKEESIFQGETYNASRAIELGLIDSLGTLQDAFAKADELGKTRKRSSAQTPTSDMKFPLLFALAGKPSATQEELDAVNAELAQAGITGVAVFNESIVTDAANVTSERDQLKAKVTELESSVSTANGKVDSLTTENGDLKAKVAAAPRTASAVVNTTDPVINETDEQKNAATVAGFAHNQFINSFFK